MLSFFIYCDLPITLVCGRQPIALIALTQDSHHRVCRFQSRILVLPGYEAPLVINGYMSGKEIQEGRLALKDGTRFA